MKLKRILGFILFVTIIFSCTKEDVEPQLEVTVNNEYTSNSVENATVKLFTTKDDFKKDTNEVALKYTDNKGKAHFEGLNEHDYYILAKKDTLNNYLTESHLTDPLSNNKFTNISIAIK
jgi:hypothetical protein